MEGSRKKGEKDEEEEMNGNINKLDGKGGEKEGRGGKVVGWMDVWSGNDKVLLNVKMKHTHTHKNRIDFALNEEEFVFFAYVRLLWLVAVLCGSNKKYYIINNGNNNIIIQITNCCMLFTVR